MPPPGINSTFTIHHLTFRLFSLHSSPLSAPAKCHSGTADRVISPHHHRVALGDHDGIALVTGSGMSEPLNDNPYTSRPVRWLLVAFTLLALISTATAMRVSGDPGTRVVVTHDATSGPRPQISR